MPIAAFLAPVCTRRSMLRVGTHEVRPSHCALAGSGDRRDRRVADDLRRPCAWRPSACASLATCRCPTRRPSGLGRHRRGYPRLGFGGDCSGRCRHRGQGCSYRSCLPDLLGRGVLRTGIRVLLCGRPRAFAGSGTGSDGRARSGASRRWAASGEHRARDAGRTSQTPRLIACPAAAALPREVASASRVRSRRPTIRSRRYERRPCRSDTPAHRRRISGRRYEAKPPRCRRPSPQIPETCRSMRRPPPAGRGQP
ncbi:hypothetical protein CFFPNG_03032 [Methylorubrum aminovorans]